MWHGALSNVESSSVFLNRWLYVDGNYEQKNVTACWIVPFWWNKKHAVYSPLSKLWYCVVRCTAAADIIGDVSEFRDMRVWDMHRYEAWDMHTLKKGSTAADRGGQSYCTCAPVASASLLEGSETYILKYCMREVWIRFYQPHQY